MGGTPAKTTVRVAVTNNAAKDDYFQDLGWLQEDASLHGQLNVLANDPGSARIIGVSSGLPTSTANMVNAGASFTPDGFSGLLVVTIVGGQLDIDASALNADLQALGEGMSTAISFYYTAQMANGAYSTAKVTIEIEGTNDDPLFSASSVLAGAVTDTADDDSFAAVTGSVSATDVDLNDAGLLTFGLGDGEDGSSDYGAFAIDEDGNWTFTADDSAVEGLKTTVVETFDIEVNDGHGGTDTETVTITLNGVNDTAEIGGDNDGNVTEDGAGSTGGTLAVADRDTVDLGFQAATAAALAGTYGDFAFNEATGEWTYTLRNGDANVQALDSGDEVTDSLTVWSADGSASETITVTIHGADDAAAYVSPTVYNGTGDPNDFDGLGNPAGQNISSTGTNGPDTLYGGGGNDTINAGNGNDTLYGGSGDDAVNGNGDNDTLYGGSGNDVMLGSNENDVLVGGYGADTLTGGNGSDVFKYLSALDTGDTITDFAPGDKIDLSAFAPSSFVGLLGAPGAVGANEVGYTVSAGVTTIYVDTDGVAGADLEIYLSNGHVPLAGDFAF